MSSWQTFKGYLAGAVALIACPCHLPITFPLLLSLTAGTALGGWLEDRFGLVFAISVVVFLGGLGLAVAWNTRKASPAKFRKTSLIALPVREKPIGAAPVPAAACSCASENGRPEADEAVTAAGD